MTFTREDGARIWADVRANSARLDGCAGPHDFQRFTPQGMFPKYRCAKCQGEIDAVNKGWYERGMKHGRNVK